MAGGVSHFAHHPYRPPSMITNFGRHRCSPGSGPTPTRPASGGVGMRQGWPECDRVGAVRLRRAQSTLKGGGDWWRRDRTKAGTAGIGTGTVGGRKRSGPSTTPYVQSAARGRDRVRDRSGRDGPAGMRCLRQMRASTAPLGTCRQLPGHDRVRGWSGCHGPAADSVWRVRRASGRVGRRAHDAWM